MTQDPIQSGDPSPSYTRRQGAGIAFVFGLFALFFLLGIVIEWPKLARQPLAGVGMAALVMWMAGVAAGGIGCMLRRAWSDVLLNRLFAILALAFLCIGTVGIIQNAHHHSLEGTFPGLGMPTLGVMLCMLWAFGLLAGLQERRRRDAKPYFFDFSMILFWPFLGVIIAPVAFGGRLLILGVILFVGELAGRSFAHPYLGAIAAGVVTILAVVWIIHLRQPKASNQ